MEDMGKELITQAGGVLTEAYKDIISPSAKPIGSMLSLLPRTIRLGLSKWEKWIINGEESLRLTASALAERVKQIPEEKQCEPEPYVAVPAIQQISYCYDSKELRDMYASLLAASMNIDTKAQVHPSFVDIIKQISPDEAKLLKYLQGQPEIPVLDVYEIVDLNSDEYVIKARNVIYIPNILDIPDNRFAYLDNLMRLRLINIPDGICLPNNALYENLKNKILLNDRPLSTDNINYKKKQLEITQYGKKFVRICLS